jgi:cytochrome c peroxidase
MLASSGSCHRVGAGDSQALALSSSEMATLRALYAGDPETWPAPHVDEGIAWRELALPGEPEHPAENPHSNAKERLGRLLFFDGRLSGTGQMSCASCHVPELGWGDGRAKSFGHDVIPLTRNTPTIQNTGHFELLFWDGRAQSMEELVKRVFHNAMEMRIDEERMVAGLESSAEYRRLFAESFGDDQPSVDRVAMAIACFVRTVNSDGSSDFDRFLRGDGEALGDDALRGLHLFRTSARCMNCHHGPLLSDGDFHDLGLSYYGRKFEDLGRHRVTAEPGDVGRFKTPSLRNVARTGPYMHNGLFDLPGVINMYAAGMPSLQPTEEQLDDPLFPVKSPHLQPLELSTRDRADLIAFLESLTERRRRVVVDLPAWGDYPPIEIADGLERR